jgi:hypothetical protein
MAVSTDNDSGSMKTVDNSTWWNPIRRQINGEGFHTVFRMKKNGGFLDSGSIPIHVSKADAAIRIVSQTASGI